MIKNTISWDVDGINRLISDGYIPFAVTQSKHKSDYIWFWRGISPTSFGEVKAEVEAGWERAYGCEEGMNKQDIKSKERYEVIYIDKHAQVRNIPFDNMEELLASYSIIYGDDEIAVIGVFRVSTTLHFEEVMKRTHFQGEGRCTEL